MGFTGCPKITPLPNMNFHSLAHPHAVEICIWCVLGFVKEILASMALCNLWLVRWPWVFALDQELFKIHVHDMLSSRVMSTIFGLDHFER